MQPSLDSTTNCPSLPVTEKHRGINLVAVPRGSGVQWPSLAVASLRHGYLDRHVTTWLGSNMARDNDWWSLVTSRDQLSHQLTRAQGSPFLALQAFFRTYTPTPRHILLQMDNSTAVSYVNKRGETRSYGLSTEALKLWALVLHAGCWITAKHIPGTSNTIADLASRQFTGYSE